MQTKNSTDCEPSSKRLDYIIVKYYIIVIDYIIVIEKKKSLTLSYHLSRIRQILYNRHVNQRWSRALQTECERTWKIKEDDDDQWVKLNGRLCRVYPCISLHTRIHFERTSALTGNWIGLGTMLHALRQSYRCASPSCRSPWSCTMMRVHPSSRLSDTSNQQRLRRVSTDPGAALPPSRCSRKQRVLPAARW